MKKPLFPQHLRVLIGYSPFVDLAYHWAKFQQSVMKEIFDPYLLPIIIWLNDLTYKISKWLR